MANEPESPRLVLLLGGARSGKSAYGETLAARLAGDAAAPVTYIATATAGDDEMRERIARHRASRPAHWRTIEEPLNPAAALCANTSPVVLLDCVTLLVANLLLDGASEGDFETPHFASEAEARVDRAIGDLLDAWRDHPATLILISNEVGMGLAPPYPLGRVYRDCLGRVNARLAAVADAVLLLVAGLPIELKALAAAWEREAARRFGND